MQGPTMNLRAGGSCCRPTMHRVTTHGHLRVGVALELAIDSSKELTTLVQDGTSCALGTYYCQDMSKEPHGNVPLVTFRLAGKIGIQRPALALQPRANFPGFVALGRDSPTPRDHNELQGQRPPLW